MKIAASEVNYANMAVQEPHEKTAASTRSKRSSILRSFQGFKPTVLGWVCIFLLLWVPLAAVFTVNNFLFMVFGLTLSFAITSHWMARKNLKSVRLVRRLPDEMFAGIPFPVTYHVRTDWRPWGGGGLTLQESDPIKGLNKGLPLPHLSPGQTADVSSMVTIATRGDHSLAQAKLSSAYPFGLARYSGEAGERQEALVFPKIEPVVGDIPFFVGPSGGRREQADPFGVVPLHFRQYVPGDPYKHIDWKKTARSGELISRVLSDEGAPEIVIRLSADASEKAISRAASLVVHFAKSGTPVSLYGPGVVVEAGVGEQFTRRLLVMLARWEKVCKGEPMPEAHGSAVIDVADDGKVSLKGPDF